MLASVWRKHEILKRNIKTYFTIIHFTFIDPKEKTVINHQDNDFSILYFKVRNNKCLWKRTWKGEKERLSQTFNLFGWWLYFFSLCVFYCFILFMLDTLYNNSQKLLACQNKKSYNISKWLSKCWLQVLFTRLLKNSKKSYARSADVDTIFRMERMKTVWLYNLFHFDIFSISGEK